jgi:hypothetical protein
MGFRRFFRCRSLVVVVRKCRAVSEDYDMICDYPIFVPEEDISNDGIEN